MNSEEEEEEEEEMKEYEALIPGLPDEVAEHCLLYLPYPYQSLVRSVSSSWNKTITHPGFLLSKKKTLSTLSLPYIFVFSFQKSTPSNFQWQAFDPKSSRWFILPPMPVYPRGFACTSRQGTLYVLGGRVSDTEESTLITYSTSTNKWSLAEPMLRPRSFFAAGCIGSKIFAAGGSEEDVVLSSMECYDSNNDTWTPVANMHSGLARYDAAVIGKKMYVTEGWTWPFSFSPRGWVYDAELNTWEEMRLGMREGWTGISVVLDDRLFVISEHGDCKVKYYVTEDDTWKYVGGQGFPCQALQRPFSVSAVEGKIYVVSCGLNLAIGTVFDCFRVEWEVVEAPKAFQNFLPSNSQIVYG